MKFKDNYNTVQFQHQYVDFHFGKEQHFGIDNFAYKCIEVIKHYVISSNFDKVLDIGCAVGRSSFELAKIANSVDALDFSSKLLEVPLALQSEKTIRYSVTWEGDITELKEIKLSDFDEYLGIKNKIRFSQADACNLEPHYSGYDLVFAGNLIDRLHTPQKFLEDIKERLTPSGYLAIASPYTWLEEHTPKENWLGGFSSKTEEDKTTLDGLIDHLSPEFELKFTEDVPFVIRETKRKFQHSISQMTIWKKQSM